MTIVARPSEIGREPAERTEARFGLTRLFNQVGELFMNERTGEYGVEQGHDVHAFYRLMRNPGFMIQVTGYGILSIEQPWTISARLLDKAEGHFVQSICGRPNVDPFYEPANFGINAIISHLAPYLVKGGDTGRIVKAELLEKQQVPNDPQILYGKLVQHPEVLRVLE